MVKAWYMRDDIEDPRLENHLEPEPQFVELRELHSATGVLYWKLKADDNALLDSIKQERGYSYEDAIEIAPDKLPGYEDKLKIFFAEHLHTDEEIRYVVDGSGYFDVRDKQDRWIRIQVTPGDLLVLPAGIYHRFTVDTNNYIKAKRFFVGEPVWTPYNRPADEMEARKHYLASVQKGFLL